ncbi:hypothetical protein MF628_08135 [Paenibacillus polymyxa]|nr:hypothetical protein [Paenibacillus polymyxa]WDZ64022.1 hypothetical protein MF628_08135 [Paenibacillus polymyxa]
MSKESGTSSGRHMHQTESQEIGVFLQTSVMGDIPSLINVLK